MDYALPDCGPYRDWQWEENPFQVGTIRQTLGDGIALVDHAKTIRELGDDAGNFRGVAAWWDSVNRQAVLQSELEAGWYRYVSEWRFEADGTLLARWGFDAVENQCTCARHTHHAYFRFDVRLGPRGHNRIEEREAGGRWRLVEEEAVRPRDMEAGRRWRVRDRESGRSVTIFPGLREDPANAFGVGDAWLLRRRPDELDDGGADAPGREQVRLAEFVDGENLVDRDVVVWMTSHFLHDDADPTTLGTHTVEVRLEPEGF